MARQVKARRIARRKQIQPRDLWLAGIGALSLARRQAEGSYASLSQQAHDLRLQVSHTLIDTLGSADASFTKVRKRLIKRVSDSQTVVVHLLSQARNGAEAQFAPLLARFGIKHKPAARKRKPASKAVKARRAAPAGKRRNAA